MNPPLLAVGFDLDYTLWDLDPFLTGFFEAIAGDLGGRLGCARAEVAGAFRAALARLSPAHPGLFDQALRDLGGWEPGLVAELVGRFRRYRGPARPYPETEPLLAGLARAGYQLFLVTDGHSAGQRHKLEALGLAGRFQIRVFTGDFQPGLAKPSCFPFLYACARLGLEPCRCAYVGDNPLCDFLGPRKLGMRTVAVASGPFARVQVSPEHTAQSRVERLDQLWGLL